MNKQLSGFTLLEVLIGMSLLSIMMLLLFASLRTCVQSWNAGEKKIAEVSQATIVQNFLRNKLQTALPLNADFLEEDAEFSFQGEAHSLQFVAPMSASAGRLGLQLFMISLQPEEEGAGQQLMVDIKPFFAQNDMEQWDGEQVVILKKIHELNIAYFGIDQDDPDVEPRWHKQWLDKQSLPELVSIDVELITGVVWPQLVVNFKVESALNATGVSGRSRTQRSKANLFGLLK